MSIEKMEELIIKCETETNNIEKFITPSLVENLNKKNKVELYQAAKFLAVNKLYSKILECRESPDFIIEYNNRKIGLELTRVFKKNYKQVSINKSISELFDNAATDFEKSYPNHKFLVEFWLKNNNFSFAKKEKAEYKKAIVDYVYNTISNNQTEKPHFIDTCEIMEHTQLSFYFNPGGYYSETIDNKTILDIINKKEEKVHNYHKADEQWLLIITSSASIDSYKLKPELIELNIYSKFNRIFVFDDFTTISKQVVGLPLI